MPEPAHLERVREILPNLRVASVRVGEDGLVNDVLIVNEEWVFRFPRTHQARTGLEREARILDLVRRHVSLRVPEVEHLDPTCMVTRFVPGIPLGRHTLLAEDGRTQTALLEQLGRFLGGLHAVPLGDLTPAEPVAATPPEWERLYEALERELFPLIMPHARVRARDHFRPALERRLDLSYPPALVHGDLAPYHLCYDPRTRRLNGVLDFGEAGPGDPAADLGSLINALGESLLWQMRSVYAGLAELIDRARFHAGTLELRWGLAALRSRDPAWFLCHLGYARDVLPVGRGETRG